ncbi:MAG: hypothetical protein FWD59_02570 [Micrococcales bacterium]|nr:hypothetical protein [Micrococcales bacterium]
MTSSDCGYETPELGEGAGQASSFSACGGVWGLTAPGAVAGRLVLAFAAGDCIYQQHTKLSDQFPHVEDPQARQEPLQSGIRLTDGISWPFDYRDGDSDVSRPTSAESQVRDADNSTLGDSNPALTPASLATQSRS